MPIVVKNPNWSQTYNEVRIILPLNNVLSNRITDILITDKFVKVNYCPYYFEAFLPHKIDANESKCKIYENNIKFTLQKGEKNVTWNDYHCADTREKHGRDKLDLKKELLHENDANVAAEIENQRKQKADFKRSLVDMQLTRDQEKRKQMDIIDETIKQIEHKKVHLFD